MQPLSFDDIALEFMGMLEHVCQLVDPLRRTGVRKSRKKQPAAVTTCILVHDTVEQIRNMGCCKVGMLRIAKCATPDYIYLSRRP